MKRWALRATGMLILCLLGMSLSLPTIAVAGQMAVVSGKDLYVDGEQLQMQARLLPPEDGVSWTWECQLSGCEPEVVAQTDKVVLDLTMAYHGAVLYPVATLADGTVLRGPEKTLVVERYCLGLEIATMPKHCAYAPGAVFDPTGCKVIAKMSDGSILDVTTDCSWDVAPLELGTAQTLVTCLLRRDTGELGTFGCYIQVTVAAQHEDEKKDPIVSDENVTQTPDGSGGHNDANDADSNQGSNELKESVSTEKPIWSKDSNAGITVAVGLLVLCLAMGLGLWRLCLTKTR